MVDDFIDHFGIIVESIGSMELHFPMADARRCRGWEERDAGLACEKCQQLCSRPEALEKEERGQCCQCRKEGPTNENAEMECREPWWSSLDRQRFDGVAIDTRSNAKKLLLLEFNRRTDARGLLARSRKKSESEDRSGATLMRCARPGRAPCAS